MSPLDSRDIVQFVQLVQICCTGDDDADVGSQCDAIIDHVFL